MRRKKGISLILLIITIIVIIILTGSVILNLTSNNPIVESNEATFKTNVGEYNSELAMVISNEYFLDHTFLQSTLNKSTWNGGTIDETIKETITSITETDGKKFEIQSGKLVYVGSDETEMDWLSKIGVTCENVTPPATDSILYCQAKSGVMYDDYGWLYAYIGDETFYIGGDGHGLWMSYLSFDTTSIQGGITSAKLRIKVTALDDVGFLNITVNTGAQPIWGDDFWVSITEHDAGCGTITLGTQTLNTVDAWYEWNVPIEYINEGGETQFELTGIDPFDTVTASFNGASSSNKPELVIIY